VFDTSLYIYTYRIFVVILSVLKLLPHSFVCISVDPDIRSFPTLRDGPQPSLVFSLTLCCCVVVKFFLPQYSFTCYLYLLRVLPFQNNSFRAPSRNGFEKQLLLSSFLTVRPHSHLTDFIELSYISGFR